MMLAYFRTGRQSMALASMEAQMGFADIFRQDSPLVDFGSSVYQPSDPINTVFDCWAVPAALIRGLWDPLYTAEEMTLRPHVPANVSSVAQHFPLRWGGHRFFVSASGAGSITAVLVNGAPWAAFTETSITFTWSALPPVGSNFTVAITMGAGGPAPPPPASSSPLLSLRTRAPRKSSMRALRSLVPAGAALWLAADDLSLSDGARVANWSDSRGSTGSAGAAQAVTGLEPIFLAAGMSGRPAVSFDGATQFLGGAAALNGNATTIIAVIEDRGESSDCCSGIFYSKPGCAGLSTKRATAADGTNTTVLVIDWSGSGDTGSDDIGGRQVVASVVYNASGSFSFADGCLQSTSQTALPGETFQIGTRAGDTGYPDRYFNGSISEIIVFPFALNDSARIAVEAYLSTKWPRPGKPLSCGGPAPNCTLPDSLSAAEVRLDAFVSAMRAEGFADGLYELAHAITARAAIESWSTRCIGLNTGEIQPLANSESERAANAAYVDTPMKVFSGLSTLLDGYAASADARKLAIYAIWAASATN
jgi:hypothetical protein